MPDLRKMMPRTFVHIRVKSRDVYLKRRSDGTTADPDKAGMWPLGTAQARCRAEGRTDIEFVPIGQARRYAG